MASTSAPTWQQQAQSMWSTGNRQGAIDTILAVINQGRQQGQILRRPGLQLAYYLFQAGDYVAGEQILTQLLAQDPTDLEVLENRAVLRLRQGKIAAGAVDLQSVVAQNPKSANAWDGLAHALYQLRDWSAATQAGIRALTLKDQNCPAPTQAIDWPKLTPQDWDAQNSGQDIIAFSLWGQNPRYLRGAVRNLLATPQIYPGWQCRFYVDQTVPAEFCALVQEQGGQISLQPAQQSLRQKLCWRFQVANDPTVRRFLVRDTDAVVSSREAHAVEAWLASDRWFHVLRDYWTHTDLILAGMWGGRAGLLPDIASMVIAYQSAQLETSNIDQWFLRDQIWPLIRQYTLAHDRCFRALDASPWPDPDPEGNWHVGQDEFTARPSEQTQQLAGLVDRYHWLQTTPSITPAPLLTASWQGYWLNLDSAVERRQWMEKQLPAAGLAHYQRIPAVDGAIDYAHLPRPGVLGCWQSHLQALRQGTAIDQVVHILEDDTQLGNQASQLLKSLVDSSALKSYDLVFTDVLFDYLTVQRYFQAFYRAAIATTTAGIPQAVHLVNLRDIRFTCTNSYLITPRSLRKVLSLLEQEYRSLNWQQPEPIDMVIQRLVHTGKITAAVTCPFLTSIDLKLMALTDINQRSDGNSQKSLWLHSIHRQAFFYGADDQLLLELLRQQFPSTLRTPKSQLLALLQEQFIVETQQNF